MMIVHIAKITALCVICGTALIFSNFAATAADIDWNRYFKRSAVISAVASAVSQVEGCSVPLKFEESTVDGKLRLSISCQGGEDEAATSVIEFDNFGGTLMPSRYFFAG